MICAKHGDDLTKEVNKEQIGEIWLCRQAIWDSQTVRSLVFDEVLLDEFKNQSVVNVRADSLEQFIATKPSKQQILDYVKLYS